MRRIFARLAIAALFTIAAACNRGVSSDELVRQGDQFATDGKDPEALLAYRNAVQADGLNGVARLKYGRSLGKRGDWEQAASQLVRAADLLPKDVEAQLDAARSLLSTGRFEDARARAEAVIKIDPDNVSSHIIRASATARLRDDQGALASLNDALELDPNRASTYIDVGVLEVTRGNAAEAEAAFKQAVVVGPKSVPAHVALANFYWATNRRADAEQVLKKAVSIEPQNVPANLALARLLMARGSAEAEEPLKRIGGDTAPPRLRMMLADYYVTRKQGAQADPILRDLVKIPESAAAAGGRLAAIEYEGGRREAAHKMLDDLIAKRPNAQLSVLKGRWLLTEGKRREALAVATSAANSGEKSAEAWAFLGTVHMALNDPAEAEKAFIEALTVNPGYAQAQTALALLNTARGRTNEALTIARQAVASAPRNSAAHLALVNALLSSGRIDEATEALQPVLAALPNDPEVLVMQGQLQMRKGRAEDARASFSKALDAQPGFPDAIAPLVNMDLAAKKPELAVRRMDGQLAKNTTSPKLLLLAGRTYAVAGELTKSEQALRKAIDLDPSLMDAYHVLGQIFVKQNKLNEAIAAYEKRLAERPSDVSALTMVGMLALVQGKMENARASFEKVISIDPRAPVASNNLAYMDAEAGTNLDVALNRAQTAKAAMPDDADVDDTLGWVYVKRGLPALAMAPLSQAVQKNPTNPTYHYHLGMAYAKSNDRARARASLEQALKLSPSFAGADVARQTLNGLQ